jgi:hypothetical protein
MDNGLKMAGDELLVLNLGLQVLDGRTFRHFKQVLNTCRMHENLHGRRINVLTSLVEETWLLETYKREQTAGANNLCPTDSPQPLALLNFTSIAGELIVIFSLRAKTRVFS